MGKYDYQITDILRGVSTNYNKENKSTSDKKIDTSIWDVADEKASSEENKTAITIMLEDFAQLTNSFSDNRSCINESNTKKSNFLINLLSGVDKDNIYKTEEAAESIKENGAFVQKDIYTQEIEKNGGVKYAADGDDIYESALNFAKADIAAIEKAYNNAYPDKKGKGKQLEYAEINTYSQYSQFGNLSDILEEMDLDGNSDAISPEEYASYLIAVDGLVSFGQNNDTIDYSSSSVDGLVSTEEVELASQIDTEVIKAAAEKIYEEHYK